MILHADTPEQAKAAYLLACAAVGTKPQCGKATLRWGNEGPVLVMYVDGVRTLCINGKVAEEPVRL